MHLSTSPSAISNHDHLLFRQCSEFAKSCEVGVDNCYDNEECISTQSRGRAGCCECVEGASRGANGTCWLVKQNTTSTMPIASSTLIIPTTTTEIPTTTTTAKYIRHLAISISPTSIQLPESKSSITAIAVPDPEAGEDYSYHWDVVAYPQNMQVETSIEGNNQKVLKLSQPSPGNYTFRVTVNSTSSFGVLLTNLNVLARK